MFLRVQIINSRGVAPFCDQFCILHMQMQQVKSSCVQYCKNKRISTVYSSRALKPAARSTHSSCNDNCKGALPAPSRKGSASCSCSFKSFGPNATVHGSTTCNKQHSGHSLLAHAPLPSIINSAPSNPLNLPPATCALQPWTANPGQDDLLQRS